ncbi:MAG: hypothetical protein ACRC2T_04505 [Thermoguttaceae bacterium]
MSVLQFETTVGPDGTIKLPCTNGSAMELANRTVRVVIEPSPCETIFEKRPISFFLQQAAGVLEGKTCDELESAKVEARLEKHK